MTEDSTRPLRMSRSTRTTLQVVSVLLIAAGGVLFLSFFFSLVGTMGAMGSPGDAGQVVGNAFLRAVIGVVLLGAGSMLARIAFLKPVSELVATETSGAVEHASGAVGRGLASAGIGGDAREVVKVRCRSCGYLDTEDARFCSSCGQAI